MRAFKHQLRKQARTQCTMFALVIFPFRLPAPRQPNAGNIMSDNNKHCWLSWATATLHCRGLWQQQPEQVSTHTKKETHSAESVQQFLIDIIIIRLRQCFHRHLCQASSSNIKLSNTLKVNTDVALARTRNASTGAPMLVA